VSELVLRVSSVRRATPGSRIDRVALEGATFSYVSGQLAAIGPPDGSDRTPYSLASAPEETARDGYLEFLTKVDSGGRWGAHFPSLRRGALLAVKGPLGSFVFPERPAEQKFLFIAGGTGIAPLRSMIRHAVLAGIDGRIRLLYSARTPHAFPYLAELRGRVAEERFELTLTATREVGGRWRGERGRIDGTRLAELVDHPDTLCFVCGPAAMMHDVPLMLMGLGVAKPRIFVEEW